MNPREPIKANAALNKKPSKGGIPSNLVGPLILISAIALFGIFVIEIPVIACLGFALWAGAGWILFAGKKPYLQLARLFKKTPNLFTARLRYQPRESIQIRKNDHDYYFD